MCKAELEVAPEKLDRQTELEFDPCLGMVVAETTCQHFRGEAPVDPSGRNMGADTAPKDFAIRQPLLAIATEGPP